ncbi:hypothetical protein SAMN05421770_103295 [Granulicella rosea]|uniref:GCN5 family acetyltransferase n=1 Tax=Granulicella rosea TaxID=474952 RepID=A0A239IWL9_9BACT|nr:GCN5 family acetyltransferase [Granulicella rosea]SNS97413.1 hypothetical protein SAMN05421770_103295 [Granulicella rosea]
MSSQPYPDAIDVSLVGSYPAVVWNGGGYVWDEVLEYRVWCHPKGGAPDEHEGNDYYYAYASYAEAVAASKRIEGAEEPVALIRQLEYLAEDEPGEYQHIKDVRLTEWPVEFLTRPKRTADTILAFLSSDAPANRLDILRGLAGRGE